MDNDKSREELRRGKASRTESIDEIACCRSVQVTGDAAASNELGECVEGGKSEDHSHDVKGDAVPEELSWTIIFAATLDSLRICWTAFYRHDL